MCDVQKQSVCRSMESLVPLWCSTSPSEFRQGKGFKFRRWKNVLLAVPCWLWPRFSMSEVKVNCMFINCPKIDFKHPLDRMGGPPQLLIISLRKWIDDSFRLSFCLPVCFCFCLNEGVRVILNSEKPNPLQAQQAQQAKQARNSSGIHRISMGIPWG